MEKFEEGNKVGGQNAPGRVSSVKWNSEGVSLEFIREASKSAPHTTSLKTYTFIWFGTQHRDKMMGNIMFG